ncbi:MAG: acyltransferase [Oceanicaulis sp.]
MRVSVSPDDHAFADGPVFARIDSLEGARAALEPWGDALADRHAGALLDIWSRFAAASVLGDGIRLGLDARIVNLNEPGAIKLSGPAAIRGVLRADSGGRIEIGEFCYIGDGVVISAHQSVSVGRCTLLAHGVQIFDNNSHPTQTFQREVQFRRMLGDKSVYVPMKIGAAPVAIGANCWIGMNSLIMRGVSIGDGTIVAAASVVTSDLPAGVVAAGNPARVVRELTTEELELSAGES